MKKLLLIALAASGLLFAGAAKSEAGVSVGIGVGVPVGYYGYPYGYPYGYGYPGTFVWTGPGWYWRGGHRVWIAHRPYYRHYRHWR